MNPFDIQSYIPQRAPFVMINEVVYSDEQLTRSSFIIPHDGLFLKKGDFSEAGLVENMAQTAGAGNGYRYKKAGERAPGGYIAAIKNLIVHSLPKAGDKIITETMQLNSIMNVHVVTACVYLDEILIASCELRIFLQKVV